MASLINLVSSEPDAPTSVPATISAKLFSVKPLAATASPVHALRSEMTTGMSAPPIGRTKATPRTRASTINAMKENGIEATASTATAKPTIVAASSKLTICCPGYVIGVPVISSWSLANATMLPANDTEPMTMLKTLGNTSAKGGCTPNFSSSATATSAAAPPPTPLKRATICGMAVMRTMRAPTVPISVPITSPTAVISKPACVKWRSGTVAPSAITMPAAAVKLPLRAPLGELSCFRPRMNSAAAKRYARAMIVFISWPLAGL